VPKDAAIAGYVQPSKGRVCIFVCGSRAQGVGGEGVVGHLRTGRSACATKTGHGFSFGEYCVGTRLDFRTVRPACTRAHRQECLCYKNGARIRPWGVLRGHSARPPHCPTGLHTCAQAGVPVLLKLCMDSALGNIAWALGSNSALSAQFAHLRTGRSACATKTT